MFREQTFEALLKRVLENIKGNNLDKREGSVSYNLLAPLAEELAKAYIEMGNIVNMAFISDNYDTFLEKRVNEFGVYRKLGDYATGAIKVEGENDAYITNGTIVAYGDLEFVVLNDIVLPDENIIYVQAQEVGAEYNLKEGTAFSLKESNYKITSLVNEEAFENGADVETDEELRERFENLIQNPRTSGNVNNYMEWALECEGVGKVKVYPLWNGNGTVKILIIGTDNLPCSEETIQEVYEYIEEQRPIGATITIETPELLELNFEMEIKLDSAYSLNDTELAIKEALEEYINSLESNDVTYIKALSTVGDLEHVDDIKSFTINGVKENIAVGDYKIAIIKTVTISEVV